MTKMGDNLYGLCITHSVTCSLSSPIQGYSFSHFFLLFHKKLNITKHIYSRVAMYRIYKILIEHNMYVATRHWKCIVILQITKSRYHHSFCIVINEESSTYCGGR